jgi:sucrose-6-phosphate hydrolase SacC (GH32 family)
MHWGHAVSKDLVRWREQGVALYPDEFGAMFSGSAVVDWQNTSGLGAAGKPAMVLAYTAAGQDIQGIASSTDGRTFTKFPGNPVVKKFTNGNRDPKVFWHDPTKRWVMVLYVELEKRHTIHILTSADLKNWKLESHVDGFFECPDLFPLAVDGDAQNVKWLMLGASSEYKLGTFDGRTFTPETPLLKGHRGRGFYAAQSFSDIPPSDGRRILVGWFQAPSPGMAFNQAMSVPLDLRLLTTPEGPRLSMTPVSEIETLRTDSKTLDAFDLKPGDDPLAGTTGALFDVRLEFEPGDAETIALDVRGVSIVYDAKRQELVVNGDHRAPAPLRDGRQRLTVLADRTGYEIFASDGLTYVPFPVIPKPDARGVRLSSAGGMAKVISLGVHTLGSMWDDRPAGAEKPPSR